MATQASGRHLWNRSIGSSELKPPCNRFRPKLAEVVHLQRRFSSYCKQCFGPFSSRSILGLNSSILSQALGKSRCKASDGFIKACNSTYVDSPTISHLPQSDIFKLPNKRSLGYYLCGDPKGEPVFFFHGSPSSRLEASDWHKVGLKMGICVIGIDSPGMGLSSFVPGYSMLCWPRDVHKLALHLGYETFHVFGGSGGGPYALACAHELPQAELKGTGVLAGMGPPEAGFAGTSWQRWAAFQINKWLPPSMLHFILDRAIVQHVRSGCRMGA